MTAASAEATAPRRLPVRVIEPWRGGVIPRFHEVWRYRSLIPYVGKQFVVKRYRRTYLGLLWIPLRPGIDIASRALLFGGVLQVSSGTRPYLISLAFATAGWTIFDGCIKWGIRAVRVVRSIAKGVHFPRTVGVIGTAFPAILEFVLYSIVAMLAAIYYLVAQGNSYLAPPSQMLTGIAGIVILMAFGLTVGLFVGPLAAITKEVRYVMAYVMQFWYFVTPVLYDLRAVPDQYQPIAELNPITAGIEMVKFGFLNTTPPTTKSLVSCFVTLPILVCAGLWFSSKFERAAVARL